MGTTDQSKLMFSIGLSDSLDSSSDDIIPMQSRKKKRTITRKNRNSRLAPSSSFLKTNYSYGICTLIKFILVLLILISTIIGMVVVYSLSKRMDLLHLSVMGIQSNNRNLPDDLHSLHEKYRALEQESTNLKINLNNVIITTSNLTQQTAQLNQKLNEALNQLSVNNNKELSDNFEELKKMVIELRDRISSSDNESKKFSFEDKLNFESKLDSFEDKLRIMEKNVTSSWSNYTLWSRKIEQTITVINEQLKFMNDSLTNMVSGSSILDHSKTKSGGTNEESTGNTTNSSIFEGKPTDLTVIPSSDVIDHNPIGTGHIIKKVLTIDNVTQEGIET